MDTQKAIEEIVQGTAEAWRVSCGQKIIGTRDELLVRQCADVALGVLGLPVRPDEGVLRVYDERGRLSAEWNPRTDGYLRISYIGDGT